MRRETGDQFIDNFIYGIDVQGYMYWSLLDNFEWVLGYDPTFGLVAVDLETFERRPKPSATWLGAIARANRIEVA